MITWSAFDKFDELINKYMPSVGEGETMASQVCTAVCKLIYKWFNDGDVYDNTYMLEGWANDLSSYANWLWTYTDATVLAEIKDTTCEEDYTWILWSLATSLIKEDKLAELDKKEKIGSIYKCEGVFKFEDREDEEDWY